MMKIFNYLIVLSNLNINFYFLFIDKHTELIGIYVLYDSLKLLKLIYVYKSNTDK